MIRTILVSLLMNCTHQYCMNPHTISESHQLKRRLSILLLLWHLPIVLLGLGGFVGWLYMKQKQVKETAGSCTRLFIGRWNKCQQV